MFEFVWQKLKIYARVIFYTGLVLGIIIFFLFLILATSEEELGLLIVGLLVAPLITIYCLISAWMVHGFAEIIENTEQTALSLVRNSNYFPADFEPHQKTDTPIETCCPQCGKKFAYQPKESKNNFAVCPYCKHSFDKPL